MSKLRLLITLVIALAGAFGLSYYVYRVLKAKPPVITMVPPPTVHVVVAKTKLDLATRLKPEHVKLLPWPEKTLPVGYFSKVEDIVDRVLLYNVVENEPILESKLAPREAGVGLAPIIPEGMRAISIPVNEVVGIAGFVLPGTRVDVLLTTQIEGATMTKTVLQNIPVLGAGQKIQPDPEGKPITTTVVTLLVSPEEAEKLVLASDQGKIQLSLRNNLDLETAETPGAEIASLIGVAEEPPPPQPQPPQPQIEKVTQAPKLEPPKRPAVEVEIIQGNTRSIVKF